MMSLLWCVLELTLLTRAVADPLVFEHLGTTWTIEVKGSDLEVTADCAENTWCGFGFNKDLPQMDGSDVFTFGYHATADLVDCPTKGCGTTGCGCGCGCGTRRLRQPNSNVSNQNPYIPRARDLKVQLPKASAPGTPKSLEELGGVVGVAMNGVLFVHEHPEEGWTWLFDNCGGHGDTYGHYHYHAPPLCLLKSLGLPVPKNSSWWKFEGEKAWPESGPEVQVGWALDGAPIMGPFKAGVRAEKKLLDECHGAIDETTGEYRYYVVPEAPYMPPCLRGVLGKVENFRSSKEGQPCSLSGAQQVEISTLEDGKVITANGCPEHQMFKKVQRGLPFDFKGKTVRKLHNHGGSHNYGTCPTGAGCGCGCGSTCGCGCGTTTAAACGCGCGCGTTTAACGCGCGCGTTTAACGCGCGCGTTTAACGCGCGCGTTTAACGCGCGCGTTTAACGCGCGCGTTCGCGCGTTCGCGATYQCQGQMFCAKGLTKQGPVLTVPVSLSQCNGFPGSITIDEKQDLTSYSLTFEGGRMKASAKRALNTGDSTDYVLSEDTPYYILIAVGSADGDRRPAYQVGFHGSPATQTLVCMSTLTMMGACKPPSEWSGAPSLETIKADASDSTSPVLSSAITAALLWLVH